MKRKTVGREKKRGSEKTVLAAPAAYDEEHPPQGLREFDVGEPDDEAPDESIWDAHGHFGGGHGMTDPD